MSTWYEKSYAWISKQKLENPDMDMYELRKHCSKNFPYGARKHHPYHAFLSAMRDHFGRARRLPRTEQNELFSEEAEI